MLHSEFEMNLVRQKFYAKIKEKIERNREKKCCGLPKNYLNKLKVRRSCFIRNSYVRKCLVKDWIFYINRKKRRKKKTKRNHKRTVHCSVHKNTHEHLLTELVHPCIIDCTAFMGNPHWSNREDCIYHSVACVLAI